jgi:hypothetical protein
MITEIMAREVLKNENWFTFISYQIYINLLKPSGNFTYDQV